MAAKPLPDQTTLLKLLRYEPETGKLFWRDRPPELFADVGRGGRLGAAARWNGRHSGREAGSVNVNGYIVIGISCGNGFITIMAHRVIWCMFYGKWPDAILDHINGDRSDNRISNIRPSDFAKNARNICLPSNNTSGICGVSWDSNINKWFAQIIVNGKRHYLGAFSNKIDAANARREADRRFGFSDGHGKPKLKQYARPRRKSGK